MATIRVRERSSGTSYTVTWRDPESGIQSKTFSAKEYVARGRAPEDARDAAEELKTFLDANGNSFKLATDAKRIKTSTAPTVTEMVEMHLKLCGASEGTLSHYRAHLRDHIGPKPLGKMAIDMVTREAVIEWQDSLVRVRGPLGTVGKPLAPKSKRNIHGLLSDAFKTAMTARPPLIDWNPAYGLAVDAEGEDDAAAVYISEDDLETIIRETPNFYRPFVLTLGLTGLRFSEATAFRKRDVIVRWEDKGGSDPWRRCTIKVGRAWKDTRSDEGVKIGATKTKRSNRAVACNRRLSEALLKRMEKLGPDDLVFTTPAGTPLRNYRFHADVWQPMTTRLVETGLLDQKPRIHDLRAAHTTHLLERNVPLQDVQGRLGHEDPKTTLKIYTRLGKNSSTIAADALSGNPDPAPPVATAQRAEATPPSLDIISQLERLLALREAGALTPEEFTEQKALVLSSRG